MSQELKVILSEQLNLLEKEGSLLPLASATKEQGKLTSPSKKPRKLTNHQIFISRTVKGMQESKDRIIWAREAQIFNRLSTKYGLEFLMWCSLPYGRQVNSLAYFLTPDGKEFLSAKLLEYTTQKGGLSVVPENIVLESQKIGEDVITEPVKPKTLKDFLKYGQEI